MIGERSLFASKSPLLAKLKMMKHAPRWKIQDFYYILCYNFFKLHSSRIKYRLVGNLFYIKYMAGNGWMTDTGLQQAV